ncbi:plasmid stabilization protein [Smithella sp. SC_K08D17]|jgi:plasmid stabilization system protein ParE|nr:plasmid stabilization protein [Smithella sp. D17]KIE17123.1 plasmid stabilization protein [Smithella sp. SC_K08D17]
MKIHFLSIAEKELNDAVDWYNEQADGLGKEFLDQLDRAIRRAVTYPQSSMEIESGLRRCIMARFPYGLIYGLDKDKIIIVAVAHLHRNPRYWADRIE